MTWAPGEERRGPGGASPPPPPLQPQPPSANLRVGGAAPRGAPRPPRQGAHPSGAVGAGAASAAGRGERRRVGGTRAARDMSSRRAIVGVLSSACDRDRVGAALVALGYEVTLADSTLEALGQARARAPQLLVADAEFLAVGGDEMFREWREQQPGTPKGVLAAWLHRHGPRAQEPFVDLNCAGFSRELMDSELFGHEKGAFTGAVTRKAGLLEVADRGTLFLDEIGDMDAPIQAKLLKVIEEKRFRRVGETRERHTDVRVIAATHHNLLLRVREGLFREDLYYRIGVLPMRVPALRFRAADIPELARRILGQLALELGRAEPELAPAAEETLVEHNWPGNLRELRNELERALLASANGSIESRHLALDA